FVTGHFGSTCPSDRGGPFTGAVLPPGDHIGNRVSPASGARSAARGEKKGTVTEATVPPFMALATSLLRSERVTQTHHVTRGLVDHAHELILRTRAPTGVLAGDVDGFSRHRQVVGQLVAHGQVDLVVCLDEVRVAIVAVLVGSQQVLVTPVPGQTRR